VVIAALVIGSALVRDEAIAAGIDLGLAVRDAEIAVGAATLLLCAPFVVGVLRNARVIGVELATAALPQAPEDGLDLGQAPRRMLAVALQLAALLLATLPLLAVTGAFLPAWLGAPALVLTLAVVAFGFWRTANNLQGHVRAGAEVVAELLRTPQGNQTELSAHVQAVLPGLGEVTSLTVTEASPCCGRTLTELDLRGRTGATVLAIDRREGARVVPSGTEPLRPGDRLALAGSHDAVGRAVALLSGQVTAAPEARPETGPGSGEPDSP
jgi:CPA2 family monovalent cation:H+ antiporter-2